MKEFGYELNAAGRVVACYTDAAKGITTDINTPFTFDSAFDYRFDFETKTWIYDPIIMVPNEITKLQCVEQLRIDGKYNDLIAALKLDPTGWNMIRWEAVAVLARDSQMVAKFAAALGMSSDGVDTFFVNAAKIYL